MKRFVVTGASGFIGNRLIQHLEAEGHEVIAAGRKQASERPSIYYNLNERASLANIAASEPDGIFHLAWSNTPATAEAAPDTDLETNVAGAVGIFLTARKLSVPVVFASSGGTVYGNAKVVPTPETAALCPIGAYGLGKATAERYAEHFSREGADIRIARVSNPYGFGQSTARLQGVIPIFIKRILSNESIVVWGDVTAKRDFIAIEDVAKALVLMMLAPKNERTPNLTKYNIGSGKGYSLEAVVRIIERETQKSASITYGAHRSFDIKDSILDINSASSELGWSPVIDLEQGIKRLVEISKSQSA